MCPNMSVKTGDTLLMHKSHTALCFSTSEKQDQKHSDCWILHCAACCVYDQWALMRYSGRKLVRLKLNTYINFFLKLSSQNFTLIHIDGILNMHLHTDCTQTGRRCASAEGCNVMTPMHRNIHTYTDTHSRAAA